MEVKLKMKKVNKKALISLIIILAHIISLSAFHANAVSPVAIDEIRYSYNGISAKKAEQLIESILVDASAATSQSFNIFCLFGHSIQTGTIKVTEHKYYADYPKCKVTTFYIEYCTRNGCEHFVTKNESVSRVGCCP